MDPETDTDVFVENDENVMNELYESEPIAESLLPPVFYVKRGEKRIKLAGTVSPGKKSGQQSAANHHIHTTPPSGSLGGGLLTTVKTSPMTGLGVLTTTTNLPSAAGGITPPNMQTAGGSQTSGSSASKTTTSTTAKVDANIVQTRPLFDKPNATLVKLRRDVKMQKMRGWPTYKMDLIRSTLPVPAEFSFGIEDWLPNDDFIILYVITNSFLLRLLFSNLIFWAI